MGKPNFFIIGAPKCGTTSMAYWLSEHPNIYMSPIKEPYFWCKDFSIYSAVRDEKFYFSLFKDATQEHSAIGEASVWYLYSEVAVKHIEKNLANSKYIVMLRNPVDMLYSLHWQQRYSGVENIEDFLEAWRASKERRELKRLKVPPSIYDPKLLDYQSIGLLGKQLSRLYGLVPKERVLVLFLDDVRRDPKKEYMKVLEFLGLPYDGRVHFPHYNVSKEIRFPFLRTIQLKLGLSESKVRKFLGVRGGTKLFNQLRKLLAREKKRPALSEEERREVLSYYVDDILLLSKLTGRDLSSWINI